MPNSAFARMPTRTVRAHRRLANDETWTTLFSLFTGVPRSITKSRSVRPAMAARPTGRFTARATPDCRWNM